MSIKIKLEGFEELLKEIEDAGGSINKACESTMKQSAYTMQDELKSEMKLSGVPQRLIDAMDDPRIYSEGNRIYAKVGYVKGSYDPKNPSDGYLVTFLNYGTPKRSKHGKMVELGFIQKAKQKANKKIKKQQKETLDKILGRLNK